VFDKAIRPADAFHRHLTIRFLERFQNGAAKAAGEHVIFHGHQQGKTGRLAEEQGAVERLDEAGVYDTA